MSIAMTFGLRADRACLIHNSNKLALRLLPCDVFARLAPVENDHASFEVTIVQLLAQTGCPVAALEPRVEPRGYVLDGFEVSFWTYYEPIVDDLSPSAFAGALERLHAGMRTLDVQTPHFTDRVSEAQRIVSSPRRSPTLPDADRELLAGTLQQLRNAILDHGAPEQLLHGEPHPGNVLHTASGPRFIDLETCCRGPVEFDLAHVPEAASRIYSGADEALLRDCRQLVLAMVAAWRWEPGDQFPNGMAFGRKFVDALRAGPPWPTLDEVVARVSQR
jgi:hypothetical protein